MFKRQSYYFGARRSRNCSFTSKTTSVAFVPGSLILTCQWGGKCAYLKVCTVFKNEGKMVCSLYTAVQGCCFFFVNVQSEKISEDMHCIMPVDAVICLNYKTLIMAE